MNATKSIYWVKQLLRIDEWLFSVMPLVVAAPLFHLVSQAPDSTDGKSAVMRLILFMLFCCFFLAFGYLINDFSDREIDKAAGKTKVIYALSPRGIVVILCSLMVVSTCCAVLMAAARWATFMAVICTFLLGSAYSVSFVRAKEHGIWGPIVSSFAQRGMPIIVGGYLFAMDIKLMMSWVLLSFLNGLRYVLIHQLVDLKNDISTGVTTFVTKRGKRFACNSIVTILIIEIFLLFPVVGSLILTESASVPLFILGIYLIASFFLYAIYVRVFKKNNLLFSFDLVPLELFLNFVMPILALAVLILRAPIFCIFAAVFVLLVVRSVFKKIVPLKFILFLIRGISFELPKGV